jgi:two-component system, NtrC family, response regulator HydG
MTRPFQVLIVDDDRDMAESLGELVEARGHLVSLAFSGEAGIARFRQHHFDVAFVDVKMPGMNGVQTFLGLRKIDPSAAVIMMTGFSAEQILRDATQAGVLRVVDRSSAALEMLPIIEEVKPRRVLIGVGRERSLVSEFRFTLMERGYEVDVAYSGEEALERAIDGTVDAVILDQHMPVLSGFDLYLALRWAGHPIPTIIAANRAKEHGAAIDLLQPMTEAILTKPFDPADVLGELDKLQRLAVR